MARVYIPSLLKEMTGGVSEVEVPGSTVLEVIDALEERYPGLKARLLRDERIRPGLAVWVDGEPINRGLKAPVTQSSEIHFLPAVSGGSRV